MTGERKLRCDMPTGTGHRLRTLIAYMYVVATLAQTVACTTRFCKRSNTFQTNRNLAMPIAPT
eukprot:m.372509 g.372509  ORF g.372509 m.372509 type:complete len:63 (-) comp63314_c0_seq1:21-209(-)